MDTQTTVSGVNQYFSEGVMHAKAGRTADARGSFENSLRENPGDPDTWSWLAWTCETPEQAMAALEQALEIESDLEVAQAGLKWLRRLQSQVDEVALAFEESSVSQFGDLASPEPEVTQNETNNVAAHDETDHSIAPDAVMEPEMDESVERIEAAIETEHTADITNRDQDAGNAPTVTDSVNQQTAASSETSDATRSDGTSLDSSSASSPRFEADCIDLLCKQEQLLRQIGDSQDSQDIIVCAFQMLTSFLDFAVEHLNDGQHADIEEMLQTVLAQTQDFEQFAQDEGWKRTTQLIEQFSANDSQLSQKYEKLKSSFATLHAAFFLRCVEKFERGPAQVEYLQAVDLFLTELKEVW